MHRNVKTDRENKKKNKFQPFLLASMKTSSTSFFLFFIVVLFAPYSHSYSFSPLNIHTCTMQIPVENKIKKKWTMMLCIRMKYCNPILYTYLSLSALFYIFSFSFYFTFCSKSKIHIWIIWTNYMIHSLVKHRFYI